MADLPKRQLGRTGLQVTALGYGSMELRGAPRARDTTEAQAESILNAVLDAGINFIDTSIDYGSERGADRPPYLATAAPNTTLRASAAAWVGAPAGAGRSATRLHQETTSSRVSNRASFE